LGSGPSHRQRRFSAAIVLFGSILALGRLFDRITLKRRQVIRGRPAIPKRWTGETTSSRVVVGTLLYLALGFWFHPFVIGFCRWCSGS